MENMSPSTGRLSLFPPATVLPVRSVSPLGASRFEHPLPLIGAHSPTMESSPVTPRSSHQQTPSLSSTIRTVTTPGTSIMSLSPRQEQAELFECSFSNSSGERFDHDADTWFSQSCSVADPHLGTSDELPDRDTLEAIGDIPIFSADGTSQPFSSLCDPDAGASHPRQLIIFVRHFFCGACQAYLKALAQGIPSQDYFAIPVPTNIIVIGCGAPNLIPHYRKFSECPFPIFAEPSRKLFRRLGMQKNAKIGRHRPEYMADISPAAWAKGQVTTIKNSLRDPEGIRKRDVLRGGHPMQIGGEFLLEDGEVIWCHRMRNYRDHTEIRVIRQLLELDE